MSRRIVRRMGPCIAIVVAMHGALLLLPMRPAVASAPASAGHAALHVRQVEQRPAPAESMRADNRRPEPTVADDAEAPAAASRTLQEPIAPPSRDATEPLTPSVPMPIVEVPTLLGLSLPGMASEDDQFVMRALLSTPPTPLAPVVIEYPPLDGASQRYVGELTLFIDEAGVVVRVRAEGEPLPPVLEEAARSAFLSVRFRPGEMTDHGAVKSRIRVEVVFEGSARPSAG
jgi:hypothetical protein